MSYYQDPFNGSSSEVICPEDGRSSAELKEDQRREALRVLEGERGKGLTEHPRGTPPPLPRTPPPPPPSRRPFARESLFHAYGSETSDHTVPFGSELGRGENEAPLPLDPLPSTGRGYNRGYTGKFINARDLNLEAAFPRAPSVEARSSWGLLKNKQFKAFALKNKWSIFAFVIFLILLIASVVLINIV
jgi:hypothetical protein